MFTTTVVERVAVIVVVFGLGLNELFHTVFDGVNFPAVAAFVGSIISMELTSDPTSWRAINNPTAGYVMYGVIWIAHAAAGLLCAVGSIRLLQSLGSSQAEFRKRSVWTVSGLAIGAALYGIGFNAIASGWFLLYSAPTPPNYVPEALRLLMLFLGALILVGVVTRSPDLRNNS